MRFRLSRTAVLVLTPALVVTACSSADGRTAGPAAPGGTAASTSPASSPASSASSASSGALRGAPAAGTPAPSASTAASVHEPTQDQIRATTDARVQQLIAGQPRGGVSVAALNTATGASFTAGATSGMWTASTYKLLALIAIVLNGGDVDDYLGLAEQAIENSDNTAGYSLFLAAGGDAGLDSALRRLGATHTVPGSSDPTFTRTSASDYIRVLKALVTPGLLPAGQREQIIELMQDVEADQRWGVGAAADTDDHFANKNGWLSIDDDNGPGETDNGLWAVNSVGIVEIHHQRVLMAIFTEHQQSMGAGVQLVQKLATTIAPAVAPA